MDSKKLALLCRELADNKKAGGNPRPKALEARKISAAGRLLR